MIKYFNEALVLTSQNPEGLINFVYDSGDTSIWYIIPRVDTSLSINKLFVNGLDLSGGIDSSNLIYEPSLGYALIVDFDGDPSVGNFIISTTKYDDFDYNLTFDVYDTSTINSGTLVFESYDISIYNRRNIIAAKNINTFETTNILTEGDTSYLLLRTNPKLSGNIKLVADASNRIFLDTFKVSDILSDKKYRHQAVSGNSVFSSDIRRVFADLPLGELYRLDSENTLDIKLPKTDLFNQYELNYSYGSRLFLDELYSEDYAILAPLWINKEVPSYFAVFRLDGTFNQETYDETDLSGLANKYLSEGKLHKTWSIKEASPIGTYLRSHIEELSQFRAPVFLSLTDPKAVDFDPNTWYGSAVDKGINTGRSEVPYFFNQKASNFTDLNAFISNGFERNNLLLPNMVNMEFAFSDTDVSLYSMHRYFGLYLTENDLYKISYYADSSGGDISIISLDGRDSSVFFNSIIFDSSGNISSNYENRIFGLDDVLSFKRITQSSNADGSDYDAVSEWVNKPGANLFSAEVESKEFNDFITFKIQNILEPGEHLRIINKDAYIIWEVYGIADDILEAGEALTYASEYKSVGYPIVYRCPFSTKGDISDQIQAIQNAFNVFDDYESTPFKSGIRKSDEFSLLIKDEFASNDYFFQRITSNIVNDPCDASASFSGVAKPNDIEFFGRIIPDASNFEIVECDSSYGPINFEIFGVRESITLNLMDTSSYYIYSLNVSYGNMFTDNMLYLSEEDQWYRLIKDFDVSTNNTQNYSFSYVSDPIESKDNIVIMTEYKIDLLNDNHWNGYDVYPLSIALMGINPVKDIDYTVYDATLGYKSQYWYDRSDDASTLVFDIFGGDELNIHARNSYEIVYGTGNITVEGDTIGYSAGFKFNTFFGDASIITTSATKITYNILDGSTTFTSLVPGSSEENIDDYYQDPSTKQTLKYGLTVPTVSKWAALGNDCRGNPLRLILNGGIFESSTNFIPAEGAFEDEISYPMYKYLDSGDRAWQSYTYFDINDAVEYDLEGIAQTNTLKQFMFDFPEVDIFSKLVYSNEENIKGTYIRSAIVYYNQYKDIVEGIINGLNLSLNISAGAKSILNAKDWDRYRISLISTPSRNNSSNEPMDVIINENTETILIIWYQGNDILNYSYRNSSTLGGKGLLSNNLSNKKWEGFITGDPNYSHVKPPYWITLEGIAAFSRNIYGSSDTGYSVAESSPFVQLNLDLVGNINSIFNAYGNNYVTLGGVFTSSVNYDTLFQYVNYIYNPSNIAVGETIINKSFKYLSNDNIYDDNTTKLESLNYILAKNNIEYYIIRGTDIINKFNFKPLSISIIEPRSYTPPDSSISISTFLGWHQPIFNDFFNFNSNENDDLIGIVDKDFTLSNTFFRSYENIPQYWYNKVVEAVDANDIAEANAINYHVDFNIFKSQWDKGYYMRDTNAGEVAVDGFNSTLELPSFFGSKLIKLPDTLELDIWDSTSADVEEGQNWNTFSFNLTRNIINSFKANSDFLFNWAGLTITDNIIDGYIKSTIVNYYNITRPKIEVNIYTKPYDGQRLHYELDNAFGKSQSKNVEGTINFVNGDYIYNMQVDLLPDLSYYISFTLVEK